MNASPEIRFELELAAVTDVGTEREHNEDQCGHLLESEACGLLVVADGVSSAEAGETASQTAVAATLRTFGEQPPGTATAKRLYRAVQQANIEIYDLATVVPEAKELAAGDSVEVARECLDEELPAGEGQQVPLVRLDQTEER